MGDFFLVIDCYRQAGLLRRVRMDFVFVGLRVRGLRVVVGLACLVHFSSGTHHVVVQPVLLLRARYAYVLVAVVDRRLVLEWRFVSLQAVVLSAFAVVDFHGFAIFLRLVSTSELPTVACGPEVRGVPVCVASEDLSVWSTVPVLVWGG